MRKILLSGVHGVGKSYFIENKLKLYTNVKVISASNLIGRHKNPEDAGNKRVSNVIENQSILIQELKNSFKDINKTIVLDGHLVILSKSDKLERIPESYFEEGMFNTLFIIQDEPAIIHERLYRRDGFYKLDISTIDRMQSEELEYARELEKKGVDVVYFTPSSDMNLISKYLV